MVHVLALRCVELHVRRLAEEQGLAPCASWPGLTLRSCNRAQARKENKMAAEKSGKKPERPGGAGLKEDRPDSGEATSRSKRMAYICWNDGAPNYVEPGWEWFTCWRCGELVYTS